MKTLTNSQITAPAQDSSLTLSGLWHPFRNWSRRIAAKDALSSLSERHLRDIGVVRADIETAIDRELSAFRAR